MLAYVVVDDEVDVDLAGGHPGWGGVEGGDVLG